MFDHLLESSHRDDSNKWSNIGFGQEIMELALIKVNFTHLIWSCDNNGQHTDLHTPFLAYHMYKQLLI